MTQKSNLFKGQQKKKTIAANRHGKVPQTRKGKRIVKPLKTTKDMDTDRELTRFINQCNEIKAATFANKEGGQLRIIKPTASESSKEAKDRYVTHYKAYEKGDGEEISKARF